MGSLYSILQSIKNASDTQNMRCMPLEPRKAKTYMKDPQTLQDFASLTKNGHCQMYDVAIILEEASPHQYFTYNILIPNLEAQGFKVMLKERDLLVGTLENIALMQIIKYRCNKVIAIMSQNFFQTEINQFLFSFAQNCGIEDGQIKVIAITFPHYNTALHFGIYHQMKYKSKKSFWKKLVKTIHPYGYFNHDIKMIY